MDNAALSEAVVEDLLEGGDQARGTVGDAEQGRLQPPRLEIDEVLVPGVVALGVAGAQSDEDLLAVGADPPAAEKRLRAGGLVVLEEGRVAIEVVEHVVGQVAPGPDLELTDQDLADLADRGLGESRLLAERLAQGRLDVAHREAAHEAGDHQRLQRLGPGHADAQQARRERLAGGAKLRLLHGDRAGRGLDRHRRVAVAHPLAAALAAAIALAAEELGDLRFDGHLEEQGDPDSSYLLEDTAELAPRAEEGVDLVTKALAGRYSSWRGHWATS